VIANVLIVVDALLNIDKVKKKYKLGNENKPESKQNTENPIFLGQTHGN